MQCFAAALRFVTNARWAESSNKLLVSIHQNHARVDVLNSVPTAARSSLLCGPKMAPNCRITDAISSILCCFKANLPNFGMGRKV
mmetsp:Transcript_1124/g.2907  ORF Transcript_1124/g.2907 Transcript_1124/m.2907 type:complete len:85 (+) Transcript_1124:795-1049(+)